MNVATQEDYIKVSRDAVHANSPTDVVGRKDIFESVYGYG